MKRPCLILAFAILLAANAIALIEASRNRTRDPVETIELTERELPIQDMGQDNSAISLDLYWHRQDEETYFLQDKLEALGFNFRHAQGPSHKDASIMPRVAYIALELEGKAWEQWSQRSEKKPPPSRPENRPVNHSRLFPIDAARDFSELRAHYPDSSRVLIVKALIRAQFLETKGEKSEGNAGGRWGGYVLTLLPSMINVPLPYAKLLAPLPPQPAKEPRYRVTISYGRNLEPWVVSVKLQ
jgi:hypothetical protein